MLNREMSRLLGYFLLGFAGVLLLPLAICLYYQLIADPAEHPQPNPSLSFAITLGICLISGCMLTIIGRRSTRHIYWREGLIIAVSFWVLAPAIGALPFLFSQTLTNPIQAYFEAVSGFTTTGSTVMEAKHYDPQSGQEVAIEGFFASEPQAPYSYYGTITPVRDPITGALQFEGIEAVGRGLLFWRSLMQWLGGIGIVVLFVAILPILGTGRKVLLQAELPGPIKDMWTPRIKETVLPLCKIYLGLSILQTILLCATNPAIDWLEAIMLTCSTISTGGFAPRNYSIASYHNASTDWVIVLFMFLGSVNFSLYFQALKGRIYRLFDAELITYVLTLLVGFGLYVFVLFGTPRADLGSESIEGTYSLHEAIRYGAFQFISAITTTGFSTAGYDRWPYAAQLLLIIAMFLGGMSGSTAGGMKTIRQYISFHVIRNRVESLFRPSAIRSVLVGRRIVDSSTAVMILSYLVVLAFFSVLGWLLLVLSGEGIWSSLGATTASINNAGMGFGAVGTQYSFASLSNYQLSICVILMLLGRLEFFAILILLVPAFWRENT